MLQAHVQAHLNNILETLPQFVTSYDEAAWRDCLTMLVRLFT